MEKSVFKPVFLVPYYNHPAKIADLVENLSKMGEILIIMDGCNLNINPDEMVAVSPDMGGANRTRHFAKKLDCPMAIIDKRRDKHNEAIAAHIIGDVEGKTCFILDDIVDTAGTLIAAANAIHANGARRIIVAASHGVLSRDAIEKIDKSPIEEAVFTDTIPINASKSAKIKIVSVAELLAEAIKRNHMGESISELFA